MTTTPFAANFRFYRARSGMTQDQFAGVIGYSQRQVSAWEGGRREPNASQVILCAEALHCEPGDLLRSIEGITDAANPRARNAPTQPTPKPAAKNPAASAKTPAKSPKKRTRAKAAPKANAA